MTPPRPPRQQQDLFGDAPAAATAQELRIVRQGAAPLGKEQQTFNRLVTQVKDLRETLVQWTAYEERHRDLVMRKLAPLQQQMQHARREMILQCSDILDGRRGGGIAGKTERKQLSEFLLELCAAHLEDCPDDADVIALHDRHAPPGHAESRARDQARARKAVEELFGVELDDDPDAVSPEDLLAAAMARAEQHAREQQQAGQSRRDSRKGSKAREREAARVAQAEQAATAVSQSVREVYRKLASALHPDRAADDAERERRHGLMQRVNVAYEASDLLTLLTLQLEIEQIDEDHLAQVPLTRLHHYNQVLREQAAELRQELEAVMMHYRSMMSGAFGKVTPESVERDLKRCIAGMREDLKDLQDHARLMLDPAFRRQWLKEQARQRREEERDDALFREMMDTGGGVLTEAAFDAFFPFAPRAKPARRPPKRRR